MDPQHPNQQSFWRYLQQQPQLIDSSSSEKSCNFTTTQLNWLQNQNLLQLQQQQQFVNGISQQSNDLYQTLPSQQQFQPKTVMSAIMSPMKPVYEPGACARILVDYMHRQSCRPEDNNIEFWKNFVFEYFAPNGNKRICFSMHEIGKKETKYYVSSVWKCDICGHNSRLRFETSFDDLPKLFKVKYDGGILEDLLHVDKHREYTNSSGQVVLECKQVTRESVFEKFRVMHYGHLRVVFALSNMKICSWEFCVRGHEVFMIRRSLIPVVNELGVVAQNCKALAENEEAGKNISLTELQNNCDMMAASTKQLVETMEVPLNGNLGYTKNYVRFLEMLQVANNIKDLVDFSIEKGVGPIEGLMKFPKMQQQQQRQEM